MSEPQYEERADELALTEPDLIQELKDVQNDIDNRHEGKELCPDCGHYFSPGAGMARHRRVMHGVEAPPTPGLDQKLCEVCGRPISARWMQQHLRKVHGILRTKPRAKRGRPPGVKNTPKTPRPQKERLTAEGMTTALATMVWPEGVPPSKLEALLRWNTATAAFLAEVQD